MTDVGAAPLAFTSASDVAPNARPATDWGSFVRSMVLGGGLTLGGWLVFTRLLPTVPTAHLGAVGRLVLVMSILAAAAVAPLAHEIGHVIGGVLARFRFTMLAWGPVRIAREGDHIRVGLNRNVNFIGGVALSLPRTLEHLPRRTATFIAMGPLTSIVLGVLSLVASYETDIWRSAVAMQDPMLAILGFTAAAFGVSSLGIALVTLIPARTGGMFTDGAQILRYMRGGAAMERHSALMALVGLSTGATRPRDWPNALIQRLAQGDASGSDSLLAPTFTYYWALDMGDLGRAHDALTDVLARSAPMGPKVRAPYAQEAAFYELVIRGDVLAAERWLAEEKRGKVADAKTRDVLLDAIALARAQGEGDTTTAAAARARIVAALPEIAKRSGADALKAEMLSTRNR